METELLQLVLTPLAILKRTADSTGSTWTSEALCGVDSDSERRRCSPGSSECRRLAETQSDDVAQTDMHEARRNSRSESALRLHLIPNVHF
jgi:hypothetical protein